MRWRFATWGTGAYQCPFPCRGPQSASRTAGSAHPPAQSSSGTQAGTMGDGMRGMHRRGVNSMKTVHSGSGGADTPALVPREQLLQLRCMHMHRHCLQRKCKGVAFRKASPKVDRTWRSARSTAALARASSLPSPRISASAAASWRSSPACSSCSRPACACRQRIKQLDDTACALDPSK